MIKFNRKSKCTKLKPYQVNWLLTQTKEFLITNKVIIATSNIPIRIFGGDEQFVIILKANIGLLIPNKGCYYHYDGDKIIINYTDPEIAKFLAMVE